MARYCRYIPTRFRLVLVRRPTTFPGAFEKFKPVSKVALGANVYGDWESSPFDEAFVITAAEYGVRSISFDSGPRSRIEISLPAALAFGFAEPTAGGDRSLTDQMYCELDGGNFLEQLVKKASELDGGQHIDFKFSIELLSEAIDPAGYEKYQKDDGSWLVNDLENGVNVEVKQIEELVEIHVFCGV